MRNTLNPLPEPASMPDGSAFLTWECPAVYTRTLHVDQRHPRADDGNPGAEDRPLATMTAAAQIAQPGERVLVHPGVYREWVRPARGGEGPDRMIHYEAGRKSA